MAGLSTGNGLPNVVVTGVAMSTALATDAESTWTKLLDGQSGIRKLTDSFVEEYDLPVRIRGHLLEEFDSELTRVELRRLSYLQKMSTASAAGSGPTRAPPRLTSVGSWCPSAPASVPSKSSCSPMTACGPRARRRCHHWSCRRTCPTAQQPKSVSSARQGPGFPPELAARSERDVTPLLVLLNSGALRLTCNKQDAEDLVQETMLHAYAGFHSLREGTNQAAWLFRILHNRWIST